MSHFQTLHHARISESLTRYSFRDPKRAYQNLNRILEKFQGTSLAETLSLFLERLLQTAFEVPDPDIAINNLERYVEAVSEAEAQGPETGRSPEAGETRAVGLQSLASCLREGLGTAPDPASGGRLQALQLLMHLFGTSQYLSDILIRNPHYLPLLVDAEGIRAPKGKDLLYRQLVALLNGDGGSPPLPKKEKLRLLRVFKKREILRIGARDILRYGGVREITEELSNLADVLIQGAYEVCDAELKGKYGTPYYRDAQGNLQECKFTVLGMGKLGGRELNFSSDIDLMYLYSSDPGETAGAESSEDAGPSIGGEQKKRLINPEYFKRLSTEITSALSDITTEGHVYRVDLRLRPEGKSGNIAYSLRSYEVYYESWGETWERLALLKARPVAGDMALGKAFLEMIRPFVYRKYMDYAAINEMKGLKDRIDRKVLLQGEKNLHVKLGFGGIREVEFSVQILQLLYGGKIPEIQERNTLLALEKLLHQGLLPLEDYAHLREAYLFLRDVEHKLQIVHEFQTHTLPTDPQKLELCARRLGYRDNSAGSAAKQFRHDYQIHTFRVNKIFQSLFQGPLNHTPIGAGSSSQAAPERVWILDQDFPKEQAYQILQKYQFQDVSKAYHNILLLRDGPTFVHYSAKTRGLLANIVPFILEYASKSPDPDQALNHFEKFVSVAGARTTLYALLANNPKVIELLIQLFGHSDFLSEILIRYPEMLDVLLDPDVIERSQSREQMYQELRSALEGSSDWSSRVSKLRQFKQAETLRIGLRDIMGKADFPKTWTALSDLADTCVRAAYEMARHELNGRYGIPQAGGRESEFAIMALGKLGGRELNYTSDLDVLYVYDTRGMTSGVKDAQNRLIGQTENHLYFLKLTELLHKILSEPGVDHIAFKLDPRLRPEGRKSPLVLSFKTYHKYYQTRAETWERQALIKARFVAGSENLGTAFLRMAHHFVYQEGGVPPRSAPTDLRVEIREMKKKMEAKIPKEALERSHHVKLGSGGIVDIEFIVQFLQLQHGPRCLSLRQAGTLSALEALYQEGILPQGAYDQLRESYIFLRTVENRLGIVQELPIKVLPTSPEERIKLAKRLSYSGDQAGEAFLKDYKGHTLAVRELYRKIFWEA